MKFRIRFLLAVILFSSFLESLATNSSQTETEDRGFKKKLLKKKITKLKPLLPLPLLPIPIPLEVDASNKPQFPQLPQLPSLDLDSIFSNFPKPPSLPSIETPTLSPELLNIKNTLAVGLTDFVNLKNRFPNALAQIGNYSLLQACLLFAFGGLLAGFAIFLAEAWAYKEEEKEDNPHEAFGFGIGSHNMEMLTSGLASHYGAPSSSSHGYGYGSHGNSHRRRQSKTASPAVALPQYYGINVDNNNYYSGLQNQQAARSQSRTESDPLLYYNYANVQRAGNNRNPVRAPSSQGSSIRDLVSSFRIPTFNMNRKKNIMFG